MYNESLEEEEQGRVGHIRYVDRPFTCEDYLRLIWKNSSAMFFTRMELVVRVCASIRRT